MPYTPEKWMPRQKPFDVFLITLENAGDLQVLLGATSLRTAYVKGGAIIVEWTMMHRETFFGLVGQYIMRNDRGEFEVLDKDQLRADYQPILENAEEDQKPKNVHGELGKLLAVHTTDGLIDEALFELPDGTPATFVIKQDEKELVDNALIDTGPLDIQESQDEHADSQV